MPTFSFTIPAGTVDNIRGDSSNSAFEATADRGMGRKTQHRVLTAKFGDGYEQRVLDGINTKQEAFSLQFKNRTAEDINLIAEFLNRQAGKNFDFTISDTFSSGSVSETTIKVVCDGYDTQFVREDYYSLSCQLRRVYEP